MTAPLLRHPRALLDVEEAAVFLARDDVRAATRFLDAVQRTLATLAAHPEAGRARAYDHDGLRDVRSFPVRGFTKHLVFYRVREDGIEVLRVLHGARDLPEGPGDLVDP